MIKAFLLIPVKAVIFSTKHQTRLRSVNNPCPGTSTLFTAIGSVA